VRTPVHACGGVGCSLVGGGVCVGGLVSCLWGGGEVGFGSGDEGEVSVCVYV
jgi:hypothetical protein